MPFKAKLFIALVIAAGLATVLEAAAGFQSAEPRKYLGFAATALLASALKVQLPSVTGNISLNFLYILNGIAHFGDSETILLAVGAALVQSVWRPRKRLLPIQAAFNGAVLSLAASITYSAAHSAWLNLLWQQSPLLMLAAAASLYYVLNTLPVSIVICLVEDRPLGCIWQALHLWAFPYYMAGSALASIGVSTSAHPSNMPALLLPGACLLFAFYRPLVRMISDASHVQRPG